MASTCSSLSAWPPRWPCRCTVRSANDRGYECLTLSDATAPLDGATGARELHSVTMSGGIFGAVGTSDGLLAALERLAAPTTLAG